jgi:cell wall-associated NlpC family hydrolase
MNYKQPIRITFALFVAITSLSVCGRYVHAQTILSAANSQPDSAITEPVDTLVAEDFDAIFSNESSSEFLRSVGEFTPVVRDINSDATRASMVKYAMRFLGTRYRAGGKQPGGFDCSGFTGYVFRHFGISLGASSSIQSMQGEFVKREQLRPGDLVFFSRRGTGSGVGHVGMVTEANNSTGSFKFIHATTRQGVTVSTYPDGGYYSGRYITARRVIDSPELKK